MDNNLEQNPPANTETEKTDIEIAKEISPEEQRASRVEQIEQRLAGFSRKAESGEEIVDIQNTREQEYQEQINKLEAGLNQPLSEESRTKIHQNMVDSVIEQAQRENEQYDRLTIEKIVLKNIENPDFKSRISPLDNEKISESTFEKALEKLLSAEVTLPKAERIRLFRQTLEYYSSPIQAEKPLWHSTGSYSFRKGLEEGFGGGHSDEAGEGSLFFKEGYEKQQGLSVTYPTNVSAEAAAETFQQIFARISVRHESDINLRIDSEKITGKNLPQQFIEELNLSFSEDEKKKLALEKINSIIDQKRILKNKYPDEELWPDKQNWVLDISPELQHLKIGDITPEIYEKTVGEEVERDFIEEFKTRRQAPKLDFINDNVLPKIEDVKLRETLRSEAEHPFPCFITFEGKNKEDDLYSKKFSKNPTHIPFEDFYLGTFQGSDIKEARVPENQIKKVREWLEEKGLKEVRLVPLEIFEVKRIIQDSI